EKCSAQGPFAKNRKLFETIVQEAHNPLKKHSLRMFFAQPGSNALKSKHLPSWHLYTFSMDSDYRKAHSIYRFTVTAEAAATARARASSREPAFANATPMRRLPTSSG